MASTNGITGDSLVNKPNSKEYEDNYDKIFRKKKYEEKLEDHIWKPNEEQFNGRQESNTINTSETSEGKLPTSPDSREVE
jgi:hypothetical protein